MQNAILQTASGKMPSIIQWPGLAAGVLVVLHATCATNYCDTAPMHNHTLVPAS